MTLQNEGWERDYDVTEPTEPMFVEPTQPLPAAQRPAASVAGDQPPALPLP
jgi:hypothetical protein